MQVTSVPLSPNTLCQKNEETYKMALNVLTKVSPLALTAQLQSNQRAWDSSKYITLENLNEQEPRYDGFTKEQIHHHCLNFYANETAKLTIEFIDTDVMQIKRDIRFTIMDQIGIIGMYVHLCSSSILQFQCLFRWSSRLIHWFLHNKSHRNGFLVIQGF